MSNTEKHRIRADNHLEDISFDGEVIGSWGSKETNGPNSSRWEEWTLYKTLSGKFVYEFVYRTLWQGESDDVQVHIFDSIDEFKEFFVYDKDSLSRHEKDFLDECKIEIVKEV